MDLKVVLNEDQRERFVEFLSEIVESQGTRDAVSKKIDSSLQAICTWSEGRFKQLPNVAFLYKMVRLSSRFDTVDALVEWIATGEDKRARDPIEQIMDLLPKLRVKDYPQVSAEMWREAVKN